MFKYRIGDILYIEPPESDDEYKERSKLFTYFHIQDILNGWYQGYYEIPGFDKEFTIALDASVIDKDPKYKRSIKRTLKKL